MTNRTAKRLQPPVFGKNIRGNTGNASSKFELTMLCSPPPPPTTHPRLPHIRQREPRSIFSVLDTTSIAVAVATTLHNALLKPHHVCGHAEGIPPCVLEMLWCRKASCGDGQALHRHPLGRVGRGTTGLCAVDSFSVVPTLGPKDAKGFSCSF